VKGRKRHLVVGSQGSVLGVWVSPAEVSDARGARVVLESVLRRYPSAQIVIADGAYDKEGLLAWLLGEFCVALDCVFRAGKGFVVLERRWLVARLHHAVATRSKGVCGRAEAFAGGTAALGDRQQRAEGVWGRGMAGASARGV
jgi:transposase